MLFDVEKVTIFDIDIFDQDTKSMVIVLESQRTTLESVGTRCHDNDHHVLEKMVVEKPSSFLVKT